MLPRTPGDHAEVFRGRNLRPEGHVYSKNVSAGIDETKRVPGELAQSCCVLQPRYLCVTGDDLQYAQCGCFAHESGAEYAQWAGHVVQSHEPLTDGHLL